MSSDNWIRALGKVVTIKDKIRELSLIERKLVLVQQDEVKRIRNIGKLTNIHVKYIEYLYKHYIIDKLPKTYLCN
jgi:hypothetical protein